MINISQISCITSAALSTLSIATLSLSDYTVKKTGEPLWAGDKVENIRVELLPIKEFDKYYTNELNPFIPGDKRAREANSRKNSPKTPKNILRPPRPKGPNIVVSGPPKPLEAKPFEYKVPKLRSVITNENGDSTVLVELDDKMIILKKGEETTNGLLLTNIEKNIITFENKDKVQIEVFLTKDLEDESKQNTITIETTPESKSKTKNKKSKQTKNDKKITKMIKTLQNNPSLIPQYLIDPKKRKVLQQSSYYKELMKDPATRKMVMDYMKNMKR